MRPRICCIWLPRFGLHAALSLCAAPLAPAPGDDDRLPPGTPHSAPPPAPRAALYRPATRWQELIECSPALEAAGIRPGLPLKEAQARVPDAVYLPCDDAVLDAMLQRFAAVLDALDAFSPIVEAPTRAGLANARAAAYVEVSGLEPLHGPEPALAARLASATADAAGTPASAGIASGKFTAWVAANLASRFTAGRHPRATQHSLIVPPGEDALFLAPLPLETLPLPLQARLALTRLGVRTLGDFARLPVNAVTHRLRKYGDDGRRLHRLAQGLDDTLLRPRRLIPAARVELTFDWQESDLDRLTFALKLLADQLAARLQSLAAEAEDSPDSDGPDITPWSEEAAHADFWPDDDPQAVDDTEANEAESLDYKRLQTTTQFRSLPSPPFATASEKGDSAKQIPPLRLPAANPSYAAGSLRVTWRLATGEVREALLRLAEPSTTAVAFAEHLRWHAEGLAGLLAPSSSEARPPTDVDEGGPTYEPMEDCIAVAVTSVSLEALDIQLPSGSQLKLLAAPLRFPGAPLTPDTRLDPATRARYARRAIARLQARWGEHAVRRASPTTTRLPEHAFSLVDPTLGLQLNAGAAESSLPPREGGVGGEGAPDHFSPLAAQPPLWLLDPAEPVAILTPRKGGRPVLSLPRLDSRPGAPRAWLGAWAGGARQLRLAHRGGPWKLADPSSLTTREPLARDYYHLETESGRACLVYRDAASNAWFLQGIFD